MSGPNPAELQLYPRATMSESRAVSIVPFGNGGKPVRSSAFVESLRRFRLMADAIETRMIDRVTPAGMARIDAMFGASAGADSGADYLIHDANWHTLDKHRVSEDFDDTTQSVDARLERLGVAKRRGVEMARYLEGLADQGERFAMESVDRLAFDLRRCGACLHFEELFTLGESRLVAGSFCNRHLICPSCAIRRAAKMLRRYCPLIVDVCRTRGLVPWMVTLTVRNDASLPAAFEKLRAAMRSYMKAAVNYRRWLATGRGRQRRCVEWAKVEGAIYSIEVTRNQASGTWHPHVHYVAGVPLGVELDQRRLSEDWLHETGDSFIVDARRFDSTATIGDALATNEDLVAAMAGDLVEVLKYAVKFSSMAPADVYEAFKFIHSGGRRLLGRVGDFFNHEVSADLLDAPLERDDLPYILVVARYVGDVYVAERLKPNVAPYVEDDIPF